MKHPVITTMLIVSVLYWPFLFLMGTPTNLLSEQYTVFRDVTGGLLALHVLGYITNMFNLRVMRYLDVIMSILYAGYWLKHYYENSNGILSNIVEQHFDIYLSLIVPVLLCIVFFFVVLMGFKDKRHCQCDSDFFAHGNGSFCDHSFYFLSTRLEWSMVRCENRKFP